LPFTKSAAGDNTQRWEPDPAEQYYWPPPTIPRAYSVSAFIQAYQTHHYEVCGDGLQERGYEKIVIYADGFGIVRHAARQISDGRWLSKLEDAEDIIHETPQSARPLARCSARSRLLSSKLVRDALGRCRQHGLSCLPHALRD
jgi:hypothetical protein